MTPRVMLGIFVWTLLFTRCASSAFNADGDDVKYKGSSGDTSAITMYVKKKELDVKFTAHENPISPQGIELSIGGCTINVVFLHSGLSIGRFQRDELGITTLTVPSSSISCSPTFKPNGNGYEVKVKIGLQDIGKSTDFDIIFEDVSLDSSFVEEKKDYNWIWITSASASGVMVLVASVIVTGVCWYNRTHPDKPKVHQSKNKDQTKNKGQSKKSKPNLKKREPEKQQPFGKHHDLEPIGFHCKSHEEGDFDGKKPEGRGLWVGPVNDVAIVKQQDAAEEDPKAIML
ncbi:hypothetical protein M3Y94_00389300 [Aphelenchoides besseyi]|nr:hypothetical protein M3Y94_00389300 [Aphelenchoides besseyi]